MAELEPCKFDNYMCMCQFCKNKCNNGLYCSDCDQNGNAEHTVYFCTGFNGDAAEYANNMKNRGKGY